MYLPGQSPSPSDRIPQGKFDICVPGFPEGQRADAWAGQDPGDQRYKFLRLLTHRYIQLPAAAQSIQKNS